MGTVPRMTLGSRVRRRAATLLVMTLPATLLVGGPSTADDDETPPPAARAAAAAAAAKGYSPKAGPGFARPGDNAMEAVLLKNIRKTPKGAYIRTVNWTFTNEAIANRLVKADERGVVVRVLVSRRSADDPAVNTLQAALGSDCGAGKSCTRIVDFAGRGSNKFDGQRTTLHQKSWTFSTVGSATNVSLISGCNATISARDTQFCDWYQFVGNEKVYDTMRETFEDQTADRDLGKPFLDQRISSTVRLFFSPFNSPKMDDPVLARIKSLPNDGLVIRVAMCAWRDARGVAIAKALAKKKRNGAAVFVLRGEPFGADVAQVLGNAGIPVHNGHFSDERYIHLKFMTAKWVSNGKTRTRVWTGSDNWSDAARGNDELVVQVGAGRTHGAYVSFFDSIY